MIEYRSRWRHVKTQNKYKVVAVGLLEKDKTPVVIYMSDINGMIWVRPEKEFSDGRFEMVETADQVSTREWSQDNDE